MSSDIAHIRLYRQLLTGKAHKTPQEIVTWMGAMQAQDFAMARWAIGIRSAGSLDTDVISAINNAEIIRTHLLRPTWHFVSAEDASWMIDLTAPHIRNAQKARDKELELTDELYSLSNRIIENAFRRAEDLGRDDLVAELNTAKIATDQNRASHLFMRAELEKIICSGRYVNGKITYASFPARVRKTRPLVKEEALGELAKRYFTSRCPATLGDFQWWSGLPARDARLALELIKPKFHEEQVFNRSYWLPDDITLPYEREKSAHLLPTYDEYLISYVERSAAISADLASFMNEISSRGVFRPIMLTNGQVTGTWKRTIKKDTVIIDLHPFSQADKNSIRQLTGCAQRYAAFLHKNAEVRVQ